MGEVCKCTPDMLYVEDVPDEEYYIRCFNCGAWHSGYYLLWNDAGAEIEKRKASKEG